MYSLGSGFMPSAIHSGGLRYHGMNSIISQLYHDKVIEATAVPQSDVFKAAVEFARVEGILPAPESSHAICAAINEALRCKCENRAETIIFGLTGTGYFDMTAYGKFNDGTLSESSLSGEDIEKSLRTLPDIAQ